MQSGRTYRPKSGEVVNGRAVTLKQIAFQAGAKAALSGKSRESVSYKDAEMVEAWQSGFDRFKKGK